MNERKSEKGAERRSVRDRALMREAKLRQIRTRRRNALLLIIFLTVSIGLITSWVYNSKYFKVKKVVVEGSERVSKEEIVKLSGITKEDTLMKLKIDQIKANLAKVSWVRDIKIDRDFPSTVKIIVTQRKPIAAISFEAGYLYIDDELIALEIKETLEEDNLPLILDVDITQAKLGEKIEKEELKNAILCWNGLDQELKDMVMTLSAPTVNDLEFVIQTIDSTGVVSDIQVRYGKAEEMKTKNSVIKKMLGSGEQVVYIDVRVPSNPAVRSVEDTF